MPEPARLGGLAKRRRPDYGPRPTWLFVAAFSLTIAWVALAVYLSAPWRSDLEDAIGPIAAWVIPTLLAYIPSVIIGFLAFTLILSPYRFPVWPRPGVTGRKVSGRRSRSSSQRGTKRMRSLRRSSGSAGLSYPGAIEVVLADNNSTDRTAEIAEQEAQRHGLRLSPRV